MPHAAREIGPSHSPRLSQGTCFRISRWLAAVVSLFGILFIFGGWRLGITAFKQFAPDHPFVVPNTAAGFVLLGLSLLLIETRAKAIGKLLAFFVLLLALVTSAQYILNVEFGIDQALAPVHAPNHVYPGRPAPETLLNFIFLSLAVLTLDWKSRSGRNPFQYFALPPAFIAWIAFTGYVFRAEMLYSYLSPLPVIGMALYSAISFVLLSVAIHMARPDASVASLLLSRSPGGLVAARLLIAFLVAPFIVGMLTDIAMSAGYFDSSMRFALTTILTMSVFLFLTWSTAVRLDRTEADRNRAERDLKLSEERLRSIVDSVPVGIWLIDKDGTVVQGNPAGLSIWGGMRRLKSDRDSRLKGWREETGEPIEPWDWCVTRAIEKGETSIGELIRIQTFDGKQKVILNSAIPLHDPEGRIMGAVAVNVDVTEQRRIANQQKFLSNLSRTLIETLDVDSVIQGIARSAVPAIADLCAIYVQDPDDPDSGFVEHTQIHSAGSQPRLALPREIEAFVRQAARANTPVLVPEPAEPFPRLPWDPSSSLASFAVAPLAIRNQPIGGAVLVLRSDRPAYDHKDIPYLTEIGARASLAIDNASLHKTTVQAVQLREELIAFVSHDLKNPLSAIHINSALLETRSVAEQPEKVRLLASSIRGASERMEQLIHDMLDFAKIQAGGMRLDPGPVDLHLFSVQLRTQYEPIADQKSVSLQFEASAAPSRIEADERQLFRMISNLLGNAVKFTPKGGRVRLRIRDVGNEVLFSVSDNGPGIPADDVSRIFDRFWQSKESVKSGGTGLGLAIAKGIVEAHGGRIWVESRIGEGSTFNCLIPKYARKIGSNDRVRIIA